MSKDSGHRGDDLHAAEGTDIYAAADGVVLAAQEHYSWGNFVEIDHGTDADGLRCHQIFGGLYRIFRTAASDGVRVLLQRFLHTGRQLAQQAFPRQPQAHWQMVRQFWRLWWRRRTKWTRMW